MELIETQAKAIDVLSRSFTNAKQKANWNTFGALQSRLKLLTDNYEDIKKPHETILANKPEDYENSGYFQANLIMNAAEVFADERGKFYDALHELRYTIGDAPISRNSDSKLGETLAALCQQLTTGTQEGVPPQGGVLSRSRRRKLPPIVLPKF